MRMQFSEFLERKFLTWQASQGKRRTIGEFAKSIGVAQTTVSSWLNGERKPEGESLRKLANKLGIDVYDALGLPRPDADLLYMQQHWDEISADDRRAIRDRVAKYVEENEALKVRKNRRAGAHNS